MLIPQVRRMYRCAQGPCALPAILGAVLRARMLASGHPALSPDSAAWAPRTPGQVELAVLVLTGVSGGSCGCGDPSAGRAAQQAGSCCAASQAHAESESLGLVRPARLRLPPASLLSSLLVEAGCCCSEPLSPPGLLGRAGPGARFSCFQTSDSFL